MSDASGQKRDRIFFAHFQEGRECHGIQQRQLSDLFPAVPACPVFPCAAALPLSEKPCPAGLFAGVLCLRRAEISAAHAALHRHQLRRRAAGGTGAPPKDAAARHDACRGAGACAAGLVDKLLALDFSQLKGSELMKGSWHISSIMLNINTKNTNVILGNECKTLWGNPYIEDYIGEVKYHISPLSFYQVNPVQTRKLYQTALDFAGLTGNEVVWDLYCGIGTISLFLARQAKKVYGVEIVPQAIEDAKQNAILNNIDNAEFFVGKAEEVLPDFYAKESARIGRKLTADVIVVDPPRKGCDETLLATMIQMEPEKIVYVSCDSATLARDLKYLCGNGYEVKKCIGCDMFPMTVHVETVVLLSKGVVDKDNFRKVRVDFSLEDMDLTELRGKATYAQVKEYIFNEFGLKVSSLYIAQVKKKCGIETGENHNLPKSEDAKQPQVTPEKEEAIMKAFKHFGVI